AVDMFNVDNPVTLAGYLGRQQYNDWPIVYGPDFTDRAPYVTTGTKYERNNNKYVPAGKIMTPDWSKTPSAHFFPRLYDHSDDRQEKDEQPTMKDNISNFTRYQAGWMYLRYFMWNFAGRQNDLQGFGNARDSNWVSGISVIDNLLYGDQGT